MAPCWRNRPFMASTRSSRPRPIARYAASRPAKTIQPCAMISVSSTSAGARCIAPCGGVIQKHRASSAKRVTGHWQSCWQSGIFRISAHSVRQLRCVVQQRFIAVNPCGRPKPHHTADYLVHRSIEPRDDPPRASRARRARNLT